MKKQINVKLLRLKKVMINESFIIFIYYQLLTSEYYYRNELKRTSFKRSISYSANE